MEMDFRYSKYNNMAGNVMGFRTHVRCLYSVIENGKNLLATDPLLINKFLAHRPANVNLQSNKFSVALTICTCTTSSFYLTIPSLCAGDARSHSDYYS